MAPGLRHLRLPESNFNLKKLTCTEDPLVAPAWSRLSLRVAVSVVTET